MDDRACTLNADFLQAAIDDMQECREEYEPLFERIQKMRNQIKEPDDSVVRSIKDGRITPEMASRWIKAGL